VCSVSHGQHNYSARRKTNDAALRADIIRLAKSMAGMDIVALRPCCELQTGTSTTSASNASSRQEELKFPKKQPKRARLWLNDGSCIRLRPTYRNHVWSYDFVVDRTHDGRPVKILTVLDEYSRFCLALVVGRPIKSDDLLHHLSNLYLL
jgi:hypothetical protein